MKKKRVLLDMDDTICHLMRQVVVDHNASYPDHQIAYDQCEMWSLEPIVHPSCNPEHLFHRPGLYEELELFDEHVVEQVRQIHEAYDLVIVTASNPNSVPEKWRWLQKHMPFIPLENFVSMKRKYMIEADLLIDDGPHNLIPFAEKGGHVIGIPHPWNKHLWEKYFFINSWENMKQIVDSVLQPKLPGNQEYRHVIVPFITK